VDRLAAGGNPGAFEFPRPLLNDPGFDFSFSGLKTSVRYRLQKRPELADHPAALRDLCAGVQAAIVEVLTFCSRKWCTLRLPLTGWFPDGTMCVQDVRPRTDCRGDDSDTGDR
jgi:tRNA A37 threonylcarbamoyltransferase TsaD